MQEPLSPAGEAYYAKMAAAYMDALPEASGEFTGHLITDACYQPGGCGPGCPVRVGEAEDARGPN